MDSVMAFALKVWLERSRIKLKKLKWMKTLWQSQIIPLNLGSFFKDLYKY